MMASKNYKWQRREGPCGRSLYLQQHGQKKGDFMDIIKVEDSGLAKSLKAAASLFSVHIKQETKFIKKEALDGLFLQKNPKQTNPPRIDI